MNFGKDTCHFALLCFVSFGAQRLIFARSREIVIIICGLDSKNTSRARSPLAVVEGAE